MLEIIPFDFTHPLRIIGGGVCVLHRVEGCGTVLGLCTRAECKLFYIRRVCMKPAHKGRYAMEMIHVVGDYGPIGDLAWAEVRSAFGRQLLGWKMLPTVVRKFNTIEAGFVAAQLARGLNAASEGMLINVDGRTDHCRAVADGAGAPFICAVLKSGLKVFGPNAGCSFAFLKSEIAQCYLLHDGNGSGQFRSRDRFPKLMAHCDRKGFEDFTSFDLANIHHPPAQVVGYVDGFGNVKIFLTRSQAEDAGWTSGSQMLVRVNGRAMEIVVCAESIMGVLPGQFVFAPGSSGDPKNPFMEFAVRAKSPKCARSGFSMLGYPKPGARVSITPFSETRMTPIAIWFRRALRWM